MLHQHGKSSNHVPIGRSNRDSRTDTEGAIAIHVPAGQSRVVRLPRDAEAAHRAVVEFLEQLRDGKALVDRHEYVAHLVGHVWRAVESLRVGLAHRHRVGNRVGVLRDSWGLGPIARRKRLLMTPQVPDVPLVHGKLDALVAPLRGCNLVGDGHGVFDGPGVRGEEPLHLLG